MSQRKEKATGSLWGGAEQRHTQEQLQPALIRGHIDWESATFITINDPNYLRDPFNGSVLNAA